MRTVGVYLPYYVPLELELGEPLHWDLHDLGGGHHSFTLLHWVRGVTTVCHSFRGCRLWTSGCGGRLRAILGMCRCLRVQGDPRKFTGDQRYCHLPSAFPGIACQGCLRVQYVNWDQDYYGHQINSVQLRYANKVPGGGGFIPPL